MCKILKGTDKISSGYIDFRNVASFWKEWNERFQEEILGWESGGDFIQGVGRKLPAHPVKTVQARQGFRKM
jgi:hypothetical protein